MSRKKTIILTCIACAVVALGAYGIMYKIPSRTLTWASEQESGGIGDFFKNLLTKSEITLVVFGKPGAGYGGGDLADAILVVHFNPTTDTAYLISLPRDLWVSVDDEQFKINEAFTRNKVRGVMGELEDITGLGMNGYVVVDLDMVQRAVDWLGGVDVVLKESAVDWVSGFRLDPGPHHLTGEYALWLIRNRYNREGDFFRESNQHLVIEAMLEKFKQLTPEKKNEFMKEFLFKGSFLSNAQIDFSKLTPYIFGTDIQDVRFKSVVLDFTTKLFTTMNLPIQYVATTTYISVLVPTEGFAKYNQIRTYIQEQLH